MLSIVLCLLGLIKRFSCCKWISLTILESLRTLSTKTVSSNTIFNWLALTVKPPKISPQNITAFFNFMFTPKVSIPPSPSATRSLFPTFAVQERFIFFSIQPCSTYDVIANRPFKDKVRRVFVEHLHKSLEVYLVKFQPAQQFWRADGLVHHGQKLVKWKNLLLQVSKNVVCPLRSMDLKIMKRIVTAFKTMKCQSLSMKKTLDWLKMTTTTKVTVKKIISKVITTSSTLFMIKK